jgi:hypothetical protein
MSKLTVREYATKEGITLGAVYKRIWQGQLNATQLYGRWLISPEQNIGKNFRAKSKENSA